MFLVQPQGLCFGEEGEGQGGFFSGFAAAVTRHTRVMVETVLSQDSHSPGLCLQPEKRHPPAEGGVSNTHPGSEILEL